MTTLNDIATDIGDPSYQDPDFLVTIEQYLDNLKVMAGAKIVVVTDHVAYKRIGDFYGLLDEINVNKRYHPIILMINGLSSTFDYDGVNKSILIPDLSEIDLLKEVFVSREVKF